MYAANMPRRCSRLSSFWASIDPRTSVGERSLEPFANPEPLSVIPTSRSLDTIGPPVILATPCAGKPQPTRRFGP